MATVASGQRTVGEASEVLRVGESRFDLMRTIWALAWPAIATFGLESLVGLVDMLMVGRLGPFAVAGVGVGTQIFNGVAVVMIAVGTGTVALVARHVGAGERAHAEAVLVQSLYIAGLFSLSVALPVAYFAADLVRAFGVEPRVVEQGTSFVRSIMVAVPFAAMFTVIGSALRGAGDTRTPLFLGALVNVVNIAGNYVLIFGKLGFPALGVRGSGLASALAFAVGVVLAVLFLLRPGVALELRHAPLAPRLALARRILSVGSPTAAEQLLMQVGFMLYLGIAARYGTSAIAAYFIGVRILAMSFLPGFGFGVAASTLVGQRLGARQPAEAERSGWEANRLAIASLSVAGVIIFLAARSIAGVFIDDAEVIEDAVSFIRILAVAQPLMAADSTLGGALRGAGDTRFPLLAVIVGFYGARLGFAWGAAWLQLGLGWVWFALVGDYIARAGLKAYRFRSGKWKKIEV